jgi:hypothetical protein
VIPISDSVLRLVRWIAGERILRLQTIKIIRPCLHHLPPLSQPLGTVIGSSNFVPFFVCELQLNEVGVPAFLI